MHAHVTLGVVAWVLFPSVSLAADEQAQAKQLCIEVITATHPRLGATDIRLICDTTPHPLQVWDCTKKRVGEGEPFGSAVERCKTARR